MSHEGLHLFAPTDRAMLEQRDDDMFVDWLAADTLQTFDEWLTTEPTRQDLPPLPASVPSLRLLIAVVVAVFLVPLLEPILAMVFR